MTEEQVKEMFPYFEAIGNDFMEVQALCGKDWITLPHDPRFYRIKPREFWLVRENN